MSVKHSLCINKTAEQCLLFKLLHLSPKITLKMVDNPLFRDEIQNKKVIKPAKLLIDTKSLTTVPNPARQINED